MCSSYRSLLRSDPPPESSLLRLREEDVFPRDRVLLDDDLLFVTDDRLLVLLLRTADRFEEAEEDRDRIVLFDPLLLIILVVLF